MTALPKRKPARRPAMAKPAPEPERTLDWAALTAPLEHYQVPVVFTPVMRAAADEWQDELRGQAAEDRAMADEWEAGACQRTYGPCISRELAAASAPHRLPSERLFPAMLP